MLLNTYIGMSTKSIIKLAEKFEKKYSVIKNADSFSEAKRIEQTIKNRFEKLMSDLKNAGISATVQLNYDSGFFTGGKIVITKITWSSNIDEANKNYFTSKFNEIPNYLNTEGFKFQDGPWDITLPPLS
jgi:hypothetical protein